MEAQALSSPLTYLRTPADGRAWLALLYMLGRLPMAFVFVLAWGVLMPISIGLVFAFGLGILFVALFLCIVWGLGKFEHGLLVWWLGTPLNPMKPPPAPNRNVWQRLRDFYFDPVLWKTAGWTLLQIPVGLIAFVLFAGLLTMAIALITGPAVYLAQTASGTAPLSPVISSPGGEVLPAPLLVLSIVAGLLLIPAILWLARRAAGLEERVAGTLLAASPTRLQLAESRARAEAEHVRAETSEQSRRQLIVNVSHELRTPIASIRGHVEALLAAGAGGSPEESRRYLEVVQREAERLGALADDLLAAAQGDSGELRLDVRPVRADDCVREVVETMAPLAARERSVTVVHDVEADLPPALADRDRLIQVLANLVRNAIKYTPEGGIVSVRARSAEGHVELTVSDTGIGIPQSDLERVFDRFYRTDASRSRATGGFGLGLAISRDLVEAMGGTISAASHEGQGSSFTVLLKAAES
ncbi:MAG TPA: ATP-binding protein [Candidatus Dormibacteraeota bacterium]